MSVKTGPNGPDLRCAICCRADRDSREFPVREAEPSSDSHLSLPLPTISTVGSSFVQGSKRCIYFSFCHCIQLNSEGLFDSGSQPGNRRRIKNIEKLEFRP